jgi:hypothetical protein
MAAFPGHIAIPGIPQLPMLGAKSVYDELTSSDFTPKWYQRIAILSTYASIDVRLNPTARREFVPGQQDRKFPGGLRENQFLKKYRIS